MKNVIDRFSAIKAENKELVSDLIPKAIKDGETIYGELSDWLRDYHNDLTLQEREVLCKMLLGDMVIHHPDWISRIREEKEPEHGKQIELDYDAGDTVTWHCDDDGQDHTSTITGITIEVNSEGEAEVTYKTEIEFKGRMQDAYFSEYDIVNK